MKTPIKMTTAGMASERCSFGSIDRISVIFASDNPPWTINTAPAIYRRHKHWRLVPQMGSDYKAWRSWSKHQLSWLHFHFNNERFIVITLRQFFFKIISRCLSVMWSRVGIGGVTLKPWCLKFVKAVRECFTWIHSDDKETEIYIKRTLWTFFWGFEVIFKVLRIVESQSFNFVIKTSLSRQTALLTTHRKLKKNRMYLINLPAQLRKTIFQWIYRRSGR